MSGKNKAQLVVYARKKAEGLEKLRKNAQIAYSKAQEAKQNGQIEIALQWMCRAHHLTRGNPNIIFDLAVLNLKTGNLEGAHDLLQPLLKQYDFYEGWIAQAVIYSSRKSSKQLIEILNYFLSHYSPSPETWLLTINLLKQVSNIVGCCCIKGSLNEIWIDSFNDYPVSIYLDNQLFIKTNQPKIILPSGWQKKYKKLRIEQDGVPFVGSPVDLESINLTIGFVEVKNETLIGWVWCPAEPSRIPLITIKDYKGKIYHQFQPKDDIEVVTLETPLLQAKSFRIPIHDFSAGMYSVQDEFLRHLIGSPLDPSLEFRAKTFLIHMQTPAYHKKNIKISNVAHFFPVQAVYKGYDPVIDKKSSEGIVIVIPVYKGKQITLDALQSVLNSVPENVKIQLVNDASPDKELVVSLKKFIDDQQVFCINHKVNKGFPTAVNSGMKAWPGYDIILLNSDTFVGGKWTETLCRAAYQEENIGTVTPFSNDAGIYSYPYHDKKNLMPDNQTIFHFSKIFKKINEHQLIEIPTAHGFCMFIRHDCLAQTGLFREDLFAQGYGEENDFCMRARHLGWKHVLAADCFIGHKGGVSFAYAKKLLGKRNTEILNRLYPGYDEMVQDFIRDDPLLPFRRNIDLYRIQILLDAQKKRHEKYQFVLLVTHQFGGGVERAVQERTDILRSQGFIPVLIRPTILGDGCQIEIQFKSKRNLEKEINLIFPNLIFYFPHELEKCLNFLQFLSVDSCEIHHLKKHHKLMTDLLLKINKPYDVYIHDYLIFCPRTVLLNETMHYCGDPNDLQICQNCVNSLWKEEESPNFIDMEKWWHDSWKELKQARAVYVPSNDAFKRVSKHFPELGQLALKFLEDDRPDLTMKQLTFFSQKPCQLNGKIKVRDNSSNRFRICLIGAIGVEKGFDVILALLQDADKRDLPIEFVLVGRSVDDDLLMRSGRIFVTGEYKEEEAVSMVREQEADLAFFPSICPETWCYSLSIAWRAGLRTISYDIGAIAERIKRTGRGNVISLNLSIAKQNDFLLKECKYVGH
ncbi:MAG: glycosyltransferase [Commensalibacter sp.]|nr:glycosyltransferase [Commensalibacter sp.]MCT6852614.1 glycosyltransferase [Commensalibacter sp.]